MSVDMRDNEDGDRRVVGGQDWAHWAVNRQRCPSWQNRNSVSDGSVSVSCRGAAKNNRSAQHIRCRIKTIETVYQLDYRTRDYSSRSRQ